MPKESIQDIRIVLYNADAGGKVATTLSSFLAFDREITQQSAILVQRWIDQVPQRRKQFRGDLVEGEFDW